MIRQINACLRSFVDGIDLTHHPLHIERKRLVKLSVPIDYLMPSSLSRLSFIRHFSVVVILVRCVLFPSYSDSSVIIYFACTQNGSVVILLTIKTRLRQNPSIRIQLPINIVRELQKYEETTIKVPVTVVIFCPSEKKIELPVKYKKTQKSLIIP